MPSTFSLSRLREISAFNASFAETKTLAESVIINWGQHDLGINFEETYEGPRENLRSLEETLRRTDPGSDTRTYPGYEKFLSQQIDRVSNPLKTDLPEGIPADLVEKLKKAEKGSNAKY